MEVFRIEFQNIMLMCKAFPLSFCILGQPLRVVVLRLKLPDRYSAGRRLNARRWVDGL